MELLHLLKGSGFGIYTFTPMTQDLVPALERKIALGDELTPREVEKATLAFGLIPTKNAGYLPSQNYKECGRLEGISLEFEFPINQDYKYGDLYLFKSTIFGESERIATFRIRTVNGYKAPDELDLRVQESGKGEKTPIQGLQPLTLITRCQEEITQYGIAQVHLLKSILRLYQHTNSPTPLSPVEDEFGELDLGEEPPIANIRTIC
ncbi:hypothetical protein HYV86_05310 [Candidatus Woesearchaeota archaeon]|nr:hypothetical protein [Candidatus Woesearchaeota archaeon]